MSKKDRLLIDNISQQEVYSLLFLFFYEIVQPDSFYQ